MSRRHEYYKKHRETEDARKKAWARAHPEVGRAYVERNRDRVRENKKRYYKANKALVIARAVAHNEKKRAALRLTAASRRAAKKEATRKRRCHDVRIWRLNNPEKAANNARNYCHRRRARVKDPGMAWGAWAAIKEDYGHRCAYCARRVARLEQDHIEPLRLGGRHNSTNVVPACRRCNARKSGRSLLMWLASGPAA